MNLAAQTAVNRLTNSSATAGHGPLVAASASTAAAQIASTTSAVVGPMRALHGSGGGIFPKSKERWILPSNHPLMAPRMTSEILSEDEDDDDDEQGESQSEDDDDESCGTVSDYSTEEIPVWIKGEQRFISGVTEETTCGDLIEALIQQENLGTGPKGASETKEYCITERWRQVEQVLDCKTKILQIWSAWGKAQPEVKFILRRMDGSQGLTMAPQATGGAIAGLTTERDKDSGRGSPTGSINSAIVRRKRHRASKSSFAWMTHGTTIHPKSNKNSIERLMKLILEQGDIIQQQLSKLRDRELQISKIEEERHRSRERAHGKNYLLETYLKGLPETTEVDRNAGDSGVTSEATTAASPEVESSIERDVESPTTSEEKESTIKEQIKMLEKIVQLNKQIVKEEETAVKLYDRIRRYQLDIPNQSQAQIEENLSKVNASLEKSGCELQMIDENLKHSDMVLREKTSILKCLQDELENQELQSNIIMDFSMPNPVLSIGRIGPAAEASGSLQNKSPIPNSYPLYTINEQQQPPSSSTLPRNQRFPMTAQSTVPQISVHQINKFIQSNSKLGNNCNTMLDDKICPKQLFNSAIYAQPIKQQEKEASKKPPDDDLTNMGTLV